MGLDVKKFGILGTGTEYELTTPTPNKNLLDYRIKTISMGLSHCCALTNSG